ncbi:MAG: D-2-hydroxyacid dehydrogenase [Parafannyhessea umbonata]|uniref:D-2-hydroxyacid dehydrogenase n=1 Tax=Parafannyhessea umbonata TaxID=604330 RepID=UPI0026F185F1|nr:D-2-hydroxyacid dehydrogenase [Parafannyhessea umbonata]MDD6358967.1 D-2-hydroxyacid dehydrogenase [Parafannyhessea umbonata]
MPNLLVLVPFCDEHVAALTRAAGPGWTVERRGPADASTPTTICSGRYDLPDDELVQALVRADVVIGEPAPALLRRAADAGSRLRLVQMTWAGTDKYTRSDVPFPAGARLCCAVGGFGQLISQYVVAQVLGLMQNLPAYRDEQQRHRWGDLGPVGSLDGARVLVFGAGNIGGWVARRLSGFDCTVTGVCRETSRPRPGFDRLVTLDAAAAELPGADVVVGALPNNDATAGWLDARRLRTMRPGAVLVNVGRGNFVDCDALAGVLAAGGIRGAALDVTSPEPLPADHPLWAEPRCVITPHVSGGSFGRHRQTEDNICAICCDNLRALRTGAALRNLVPASAFDVAPR